MCDVNKTACPICDKLFAFDEIELHVNKCIFMNCPGPDEQHKRKRSPSPVIAVNELSITKLIYNHESPQEGASTSKIKRTKDQGKSNLVDSIVQNTSTIPQCNPKLQRDLNAGSKNKVSFMVPLAKQVQPKSFQDFFGQNNVLGENTILRNLLEKGDIPNMILWGPPGCGKTSLAGVICEICKKTPTKYKFISLSALNSGIKDVQNVLTLAKNDLKYGKRTILFMDEIHRFNKKQQDSFLESVEKGEIILIGATTENPSFILNSALLSRCRVIVMNKLDIDDLYNILRNAVDSLDIEVFDDDLVAEMNQHGRMAIANAAIKLLADMSDGDARIALRNLQFVIQHFLSEPKTITVDDIKEAAKKSHMFYDRNGEEHYNIISAMHKSIRGSDDNAALYWTTRMILSGEDPKYIARRLVRAASEDIGNADPTALQLAVSTMQGCQLLGLPECDVLLAQCAIYLARAPKSREADSALANAKEAIKNHKGAQPSVPMHLRNAPTKLMKELGYGKVEKGERYEFMPSELEDLKFFET